MHGAGFTGSGEDHLASVVDRGSDGRRPRARARPRARRSVRERTRSSRRSPPTHSASTSTRSTSCSRTRRSCPTAARRSRRAPAWSSGKLVESAALGVRAMLRSAGLRRRLARRFPRGLPDVHRTARPAAGVSRSTSRRPALRWDDERYRAMRTALTPGRCTSPRSRSISDV